MRIRRIGCAISVVAALLPARGALASFEMAIQISQPIMTQDLGCFVSDVTYVGHWSPWDQPGLEVGPTVAPSAVVTQQGTADRNGASALSTNLEFPSGDENPYSSRFGIHDRVPGLFGDTLRVVLDVSALSSRESGAWIGSEPEIVATTAECLKAERATAVAADSDPCH
jgi:hypothetical protein